LSQPLASGLFFLAFGAFTLAAGSELALGSAADMGTGYMPRMLAIGLVVVGGVRLLQAWLGRRERGAALTAFAFGPLVLVSAIVVAFGLLLPWLGLPLTVAAAVVATAVSGERYRWPVLAALALGLAAATTLLFAYALRLQIPVWPA
jgi:hypothetical protein